MTRPVCTRTFAAPTLLWLTTLLAGAGGAASGATLSPATSPDPLAAHVLTALRATGPARAPGPFVLPDPSAALAMAGPLEAMLWSVACPRVSQGRMIPCSPVHDAMPMTAAPLASDAPALSRKFATGLAAVVLALFWAGAFRTR